jgi:DNA invertase Pin-like site-specific DNA recombinase
MNTDNTIIYTRVSTKSQSLENQEKECLEYCKKNNLNVIEIIREVHSARYFNKLRQLNNILEEHENINLVIYSCDRFSRSMRDAYQLIDRLKQSKINLISISDMIDLSTASGRHNFRVRISLAEFEGDILSERVKREYKHNKKTTLSNDESLNQRTSRKRKYKEL